MSWLSRSRRKALRKARGDEDLRGLIDSMIGLLEAYADFLESGAWRKMDVAQMMRVIEDLREAAVELRKELGV